jgi:hypothetical protein
MVCINKWLGPLPLVAYHLSCYFFSFIRSHINNLLALISTCNYIEDSKKGLHHVINPFLRFCYRCVSVSAASSTSNGFLRSSNIKDLCPAHRWRLFALKISALNSFAHTPINVDLLGIPFAFFAFDKCWPPQPAHVATRGLLCLINSSSLGRSALLVRIYDASRHATCFTHGVGTRLKIKILTSLAP